MGVDSAPSGSGVDHHRSARMKVRLTHYERDSWVPHGARVRVRRLFKRQRARKTPKTKKHQPVASVQQSSDESTSATSLSTIGMPPPAADVEGPLPVRDSSPVDQPSEAVEEEFPSLKSTKVRQRIQEARSGAGEWSDSRMKGSDVDRQTQAGGIGVCGILRGSRPVRPKAKKALTMSAAPPQVKVFDVSAAEWRGKRIAMKRVQESLQQHQEDWAREQALELVSPYLSRFPEPPSDLIASPPRWSDDLDGEMDFTAPIPAFPAAASGPAGMPSIEGGALPRQHLPSLVAKAAPQLAAPGPVSQCLLPPPRV
eukprot:NODE_2141_length_1500_cov_72.993464_g2037_i0.p1 GENE.NODE_2141_length_1500_cov_72.993464_g2037_i0~~NODE_2141_length_1500_cov_72.993464_g2037_i0.p1  ORF type:complete len:312 (+),score=53.78 NODE_2141_length_1500_cov_72.993464_g2037_i0:161-1096(+)